LPIGNADEFLSCMTDRQTDRQTLSLFLYALLFSSFSPISKIKLKQFLLLQRKCIIYSVGPSVNQAVSQFQTVCLVIR